LRSSACLTEGAKKKKVEHETILASLPASGGTSDLGEGEKKKKKGKATRAKFLPLPKDPRLGVMAKKNKEKEKEGGERRRGTPPSLFSSGGGGGSEDYVTGKEKKGKKKGKGGERHRALSFLFRKLPAFPLPRKERGKKVNEQPA